MTRDRLACSLFIEQAHAVPVGVGHGRHINDLVIIELVDGLPGRRALQPARPRRRDAVVSQAVNAAR